MKPRMILSVLTLCLVGLSKESYSQSIFASDITMRESITMSGMPMGGGRPQTNTKYFSGNAMKDSSSEGNDAIFRFDTGKAIFIDHKKKTYSEITFDEMRQMMEKAMAAMEQNKQAMEAMRQMMGGAGGEIKVTKQGDGENIAGYATEKYLIAIPPMEMEVWTAPGLKVPTGYYDALKVRTPRNPMFDMGKMFDEFKKIQGMTMKTVASFKMMNMNMVTTTTVTSVEKTPIPASAFDIPAGYKSVPFKLQ